MSWDAIGALAELFGAVAVVISLIYLSQQVRQNTHIFDFMKTAEIEHYQYLRGELDAPYGMPR